MGNGAWIKQWMRKMARVGIDNNRGNGISCLLRSNTILLPGTKQTGRCCQCVDGLKPFWGKPPAWIECVLGAVVGDMCGVGARRCSHCDRWRQWWDTTGRYSACWNWFSSIIEYPTSDVRPSLFSDRQFSYVLNSSLNSFTSQDSWNMNHINKLSRCRQRSSS